MASRFDDTTSGSEDEEAPQLDGMTSSDDEEDSAYGGGDGEDDDAAVLELPDDDDDDDTTPDHLRGGVDAQGIDWERLQLSRADYRERRLKQLDDNNYLNLPAAVAAAAVQIDREATRSLPPRKRTRTTRDASSPSSSPSCSPPLPLSFSRNSRAVRCSIAHFQLRNLLYTPSLHEAYVVHASRLLHWDSVTRERTVVLDLSGSNGTGMMDDDDDWRARLNLNNLNAARGPAFVNSRFPLPPLPAPPPWSGAVPMLGAIAAAGTERGGGFPEQQNRRPTVSQRVQVGTAAVGLGLAALGGFNGEVAVVATRSFAPGPPSSSSSSRGSPAGAPGVGMRVTTSDNGITNGLEVSGGAGRGSSTLPRMPEFGGGGGGGKLSGLSAPCAATTLYAANNDGFVRAFDASTWQRTLAVDCGWAVNFATASPDGALLAAVGDDPAAALLDPRCCGAGGGSSSSSSSGGGGDNGSSATRAAHTRRSGVALLKGHLDYSFAAAWHPSGVLLATGNQDATARVWDLRNTRESLHVLKSELGAVRSLRFSPDGGLLAAAEPADFVKVYDCRGESGKASTVHLRPSCSSRRGGRRGRSSFSSRDDEEEMAEAGEKEGEGEQEEEELSAAVLPLSSSFGSGSGSPFVTCGACAGGGCSRCVDLALRHREGLARLRRRRRLVLEQQRQQQQRREKSRRRRRRRASAADYDDDEEDEEQYEEEEDEEGGLPLLGESTDDENDDDEPGTRNASAAAGSANPGNDALLPRGPFETAQAIDFFGEVAGISWSPCGSRLSIAVADATYSSLLQFDRI